MGVTEDLSDALARDVIAAMGEMGVTTHRGHRLTASAGVAPFVRSADATHAGQLRAENHTP